jgi:hypothetical protein
MFVMPYMINFGRPPFKYLYPITPSKGKKYIQKVKWIGLVKDVVIVFSVCGTNAFGALFVKHSKTATFTIANPSTGIVVAALLFLDMTVVHMLFTVITDRPSDFELLESRRIDHLKALLQGKRTTAKPAKHAEQQADEHPQHQDDHEQVPPCPNEHPAELYLKIAQQLRPLCSGLSDVDLHRLCADVHKTLCAARAATTATGGQPEATKDRNIPNTDDKLDSWRSLPVILLTSIVISLTILVYLYCVLLRGSSSLSDFFGSVSIATTSGIATLQHYRKDMPKLSDAFVQLELVLNVTGASLAAWQQPVTSVATVLQTILQDVQITTQQQAIIQQALGNISLVNHTLEQLSAEAGSAIALFEDSVVEPFLHLDQNNTAALFVNSTMDKAVDKAVDVMHSFVSVSDGIEKYLPVAAGAALSIALLVAVSLTVRTAWVFQARVKCVREGRYEWDLHHPSCRKQACTLMKATKFVGLQVGAVASGFVMLTCILGAVIAPFCLPSFWDYFSVWGHWDWLITVLLATIFQEFLDKVVVSRVLTDGYWVKRPKLWAIFSVMLMVVGIFSGLFYSLKRFFQICILGACSLVTLEMSIFPGKTRISDMGFMSFQSMVMMVLRHQSPVSAFVRKWAMDTHVAQEELAEAGEEGRSFEMKLAGGRLEDSGRYYLVDHLHSAPTPPHPIAVVHNHFLRHTTRWQAELAPRRSLLPRTRTAAQALHSRRPIAATPC